MRIPLTSSMMNLSFNNLVPVFLSLLPQFMQSIYDHQFQVKYNPINTTITPMMSMQNTNNLPSITFNTPPFVTQLNQIRDLFLTQLIQQLSFNRILLNQTMNSTLSFDLNCPSSPTKIQEESSEGQLSEEDEPDIDGPIPKILKNKISHNSSLRNDTKNIPKNYGKAILSFIQKSPKTRKLISQMGISYSDFMMQVRRTKKKVNSIQGLKRMWGSENLDHKIKKCIRILSYQFMRKNCLQYIFHSKVRNYGTHIKYRQKLIEGIENPASFSNIKDY